MAGEEVKSVFIRSMCDLAGEQELEKNLWGKKIGENGVWKRMLGGALWLMAYIGWSNVHKAFSYCSKYNIVW